MHGGKVVNSEAKLWFVCSCGQKTKIPENSIGKTYMCVRCGEKVRLTQENTSPERPAARMAAEPAGNGRGATPPPVPATNGNHGKPDAAPKTPAAPVDHVGPRLLKAGLIMQQQLEEAHAVQKDCGGSTFEILVSLGHLDKNQFHTSLATQSGHAAIDLTNYQVPADVLQLIPREFAINNLLLPIDKLGKLLTIAMACPLNQHAVQHIQQFTGLRVKTMLCQLDAIREALCHYYPGAAELSFGEDKYEPTEILGADPSAIWQARMLERLRNIGDLPIHAKTLERLKLTDDSATIRELVDIVALDPAATAHVLAAANSPAYSMARGVDNLGTAGALLGKDTLFTTLSNCETISASRALGAFDTERYWGYAVFCAEAAQAIAEASGKGHMITAYTVGLLLDIGRWAFANVLPNSYGVVCREFTGAELVRRETHAFHMPHTEAGYVLARSWRLPPDVVETIRYHHAPELASRALNLVNIASLAARMADLRQAKASIDADAFKLCASELRHLGMKRPDAAAICEDTIQLVASA